MALVDYTSSDEDEDNALAKVDTQPHVTKGSVKRKRSDESSAELPLLPSKFHNLYVPTTRFSTRDDPSVHGEEGG